MLQIRIWHASQLHIFSVIVAVVTVLFLARNLNPVSQQIWLGHDETQGARIAEFSLNLKEGYIPPRISPHFSENRGFPIFNHYAPAAYWITSGINLMGFSIPTSLKLSYALAYLLGSTGMFFLVYQHSKKYFAALSASLLYASSPYIAVEIFVRANLAEMWIFALLPVTLALLNTQSRLSMLAKVLSIALLLTAHNILSLICVPIVLIKILTAPQKEENIYAVFFSLLLTASFFIPAFGELHLTHTLTTATQTRFWDHFLCLAQIWSSPWGYAGSAPGCNADGMSFMLGKMVIIGGVTGSLLTVYVTSKKLKDTSTVFDLAVVFITCGAVFMTLPLSKFLWDVRILHLEVVQFPWRFLLVALWGCVYLSGMLIAKIQTRIGAIIFFMIVGYCIVVNGKYFSGQMRSTREYFQIYISTEYIFQEAAYHVPEYLPLSVNIKSWFNNRKDLQNPNRSYQTMQLLDSAGIQLEKINSFQYDFHLKTPQPFYAPIHYAPYWQIHIHGQRYYPHRFDLMGQPYIEPGENNSVRIEYHQTPLEISGNLISLTALCALLILSIIRYRKALH